MKFFSIFLSQRFIDHRSKIIKKKEKITILSLLIKKRTPSIFVNLKKMTFLQLIIVSFWESAINTQVKYYVSLIWSNVFFFYGFRERYGFVKALCLFDIWISMMHSPIRFGTYSNFVNVLMIFYVITGLSALILFFEVSSMLLCLV